MISKLENEIVKLILGEKPIWSINKLGENGKLSDLLMYLSKSDKIKKEINSHFQEIYRNSENKGWITFYESELIKTIREIKLNKLSI